MALVPLDEVAGTQLNVDPEDALLAVNCLSLVKFFNCIKEQLTRQTHTLLQLIFEEHKLQEKLQIQQKQLEKAELEKERRIVASELNNLKSLVNSIVEHLMTENDERNHQLACENEMLRAEIQSMTSQMKHKEQEWKQIHSSVSQEMNRLQQEYMESQRTVKKLTADTEKLYSLRTQNMKLVVELENEKKKQKSLQSKEDQLLLLKILWQLTAHEEMVKEALMVSDMFIKYLLSVLEEAVSEGFESLDTSVLIAVLGILVNVAATPNGRNVIFAPKAHSSTAVCDILVMLLVNPPSDSDELKEILLSLINNLAFEREGSVLLMNHKILTALSSLVRSDKSTIPIKSYVVEMIAVRFLPYVTFSQYSPNKQILYDLLHDLDGQDAIRNSVVLLYKQFLRVFPSEE